MKFWWFHIWSNVRMSFTDTMIDLCKKTLPDETALQRATTAVDAFDLVCGPLLAHAAKEYQTESISITATQTIYRDYRNMLKIDIR